MDNEIKTSTLDRKCYVHSGSPCQKPFYNIIFFFCSLFLATRFYSRDIFVQSYDHRKVTKMCITQGVWLSVHTNSCITIKCHQT